MEAFVLTCLIATAPETQMQKELASKCSQVYAQYSLCLEEAERLKRAFDYAENTRSEGILVGCIRTMVDR
jgi:hypothetical protein